MLICGLYSYCLIVYSDYTLGQFYSSQAFCIVSTFIALYTSSVEYMLDRFEGVEFLDQSESVCK